MKKLLINSHITYLRIIEIGLTVLLVGMPFHASFSIVLGHFIGLADTIGAWKETVIIFLVFMTVLYTVNQKKLYFKLDSTNIIFLIILFFSILITIFIRPSLVAVLFGIKINLIPILVFFIAQTPLLTISALRKKILYFVVLPALIVSFIAILQSFVVPINFLALIGYSPSTINPTQIIDPAINFYRAFSTLGGPNQLGAYLIIPISFALAYGIKNRQYWLLTSVALLIVGLVLSFSRSAWIGGSAAIFITIMMSVSKNTKFIVVIVTTIALVLMSVFIYRNFTKQSSVIQSVVLHGSFFDNRILGSDQPRLQAISNTLNAISKNPLGHGIGSAGPASFAADKTVISENWYLQIAYEIGLIGLLLYILGFTFLLADFLRNRSQTMAVALFAATCGVLLVNLFLHGLADSSLSIILFTLFGLYKGQSNESRTGS